MWIQLLKKLELCAGLRASRAEWRLRFGADVADALGSLLKITEGKAEALPCSHRPGCGGFHEVRELSGGSWIAVSADDERPCSPFNVQAVELAIYRFDLDGFLAGVAETLTIDVQIERLGPTLAALGSFTRRRVPVFVSFGNTAKKHRENLPVVRAQRASDFIFFIAHPCSNFSDIERELSACQGRSGVLTGLLEINRRGRLLATSELTELWPDLGREPDRPVRKLSLPEGVDWKHLVVTLLDNGNISISHRNGSPNATYTPRELGFESQHGKASKDWPTFQGTAHLGFIPEPFVSTDRDENIRSRVKSITKKLAAVTGINGTAFVLRDGPEHGRRPRGNSRGYWPLFKIRPETDRVRRGATRLGNSPSDPDDFPDERD
jgi:hypothetical protein